MQNKMNSFIFYAEAHLKKKKIISDYSRKNKKRSTASVNRFLVFVVGTRIELVYHA